MKNLLNRATVIDHVGRFSVGADGFGLYELKRFVFGGWGGGAGVCPRCRGLFVVSVGGFRAGCLIPEEYPFLLSLCV